jgi:hypothetical protein
MAEQSMAFMENHQISARNLSICRQNLSSPARFPRPQTRTKPRMNDPAESRLNQQVHENHHIDHNHQIYQGICVIWERRTVRFLRLVLARGNFRGTTTTLSAALAKFSAFRRFATWRCRCGSASRRGGKNQRDLSNYDWCKVCICPYPFRWLERKPNSFHPRHENQDRKTASGRPGTLEFERKPIMTCRIERFVIEEDHVILCISGRIREQDVDLLRSLLEQEGSLVAIDLKDVLIVDREAIKLLAMRESSGVVLRNCPAYIREWVTRERAVINASEQGIEASEDSAY